MKFAPSAPRSSASCSSAWQKNAVTQARFGVDRVRRLGRPRGATSRSSRRPSAGPLRDRRREGERADAVWAARWIVSRRVQATHTGGGGRWIGFGTTLRGGMRHVFADVAGEGCLGHAPQRDADALLPHGALVAGSTPNASSSTAADPSPVPNSTRPSDTRSRAAMRSATRAGWLIADGSCTMPCPRRMRESAARRRRGTPPVRSSASTPRGSGARPPRRSRCRAGRPARSARAPPGRRGARPRPTGAGPEARRRCRTSLRGPPAGGV